MKVLYGVVGEGMGHAIRSRVVLSHLTSLGHEIEIIASSRAADYLGARFSGVNRIHGLHILTDENRVRKSRTFWSNVFKGAVAIPRQIAAYFELIETFRPDVVISDFESWTYFYGKLHRLPVISVDNQQVISRCQHPPEILEGERANFELVRALVRGKLPFCDHYLVTSFFFPPIIREHTTLHPPILRPEILALTPTKGDHVLVYQTAEGHGALAEVLAHSGIECRIYGMRRSIIDEQVEGNLRFRPFNETVFLDDLASARAVITGGGFTLMSECVYLRKPVLSVPLAGQFEQILNARWLQYEGYGLATDEIDTALLSRFLDDLARYEDSLARYTQDGNRDLLGALELQLDRAEAGLY